MLDYRPDVVSVNLALLHNFICIYVCIYLFRHHKKMFKIQVKRMATIRYYIMK